MAAGYRLNRPPGLGAELVDIKDSGALLGRRCPPARHGEPRVAGFEAVTD
jgi:hypothetical protein